MKFICIISFSIPHIRSVQFSLVAQLCPTLCGPMNHSTPSLPVHTNSRSPPKPMSIVSVMPSNQLILCRLLLLPPSIFPSIRVFSNESALCIRWPKYWSFSFNISPSNEHPGLIFRRDWYKGYHVIAIFFLCHFFFNCTLTTHKQKFITPMQN